MISVRCPHCQAKLKVDEGKIPPGITSFKCANKNCGQLIPISLLSKDNNPGTNDAETVLVQPLKSKTGWLTVLADEDTPAQEFSLHEGITTVGRKSSLSKATISVITSDRSMSREHIRIEVKKESKGGYKHYLSDNNSKNHTLYNSSYLEEGEVVVLNDNDEIIIGRTVLRFNE